jgi:acyl-CoA thioester hydrolase
MKPSPDRLLISNYPHRLDVPARFTDLDPLNHLNNVAIGNFYEEGRAAFNHMAFKRLAERRRPRMVMAHASISFLREGRYPGLLTVATGVLKVGGSSFTLGHALYQRGECIGVAESKIVHTPDGGAAPLPEDFRAVLESLRIGGQVAEAAAQPVAAQA